jgi:hypothetical protein
MYFFSKSLRKGDVRASQFGLVRHHRWSARQGLSPAEKNRSRPCARLLRGPLLEFNVGSHPGDSTHYVNAKDLLSLSLLQARLIDLKLPIKIVEGE